MIDDGVINLEEYCTPMYIDNRRQDMSCADKVRMERDQAEQYAMRLLEASVRGHKIAASEAVTMAMAITKIVRLEFSPKMKRAKELDKEYQEKIAKLVKSAKSIQEKMAIINRTGQRNSFGHSYPIGVTSPGGALGDYISSEEGSQMVDAVQKELSENGGPEIPVAPSVDDLG